MCVVTTLISRLGYCLAWRIGESESKHTCNRKLEEEEEWPGAWGVAVRHNLHTRWVMTRWWRSMLRTCKGQCRRDGHVRELDESPERRLEMIPQLDCTGGGMIHRVFNNLPEWVWLAVRQEVRWAVKEGEGQGQGRGSAERASVRSWQRSWRRYKMLYLGYGARMKPQHFARCLTISSWLLLLHTPTPLRLPCGRCRRRIPPESHGRRKQVRGEGLRDLFGTHSQMYSS